MADRVSMSSARFNALVTAASRVGCICPNPANREHDGRCIGCWALAKRVEHLRYLLARTSSPTLTRILGECEEEQQFRARELPKAERRFLDAQKADEANG